MNNIVILIISMVVLLIIFIITLLIISKNKINESLTYLNLANEDINVSLKKKYSLYKELIGYIKDNLSIQEDSFDYFLNFKRGEYSKEEIINLLDQATKDINIYVEKYNDLLKNKDFLNIKRKLYYIEINLEAIIEYFNNKLVIYDELKSHGPTSFATKLFEFEEFKKIIMDKKEISRLISLN